MSIQETKLSAIAAAIRYVEDSGEPICADDFPDRIRALKAGSGGTDGCCFSVLVDTQPDTAIYTGEIFCAGMELIEQHAQYEVIGGL